MPELIVQNLSKRFGEAHVLADVSFTVRDGEFFTLLGPSGCGKSTTLNCIAGLERPDAGTIRLADILFVDAARGRFVPPETRNLGMVFQSYALWPHMTVAGNLALPLKIRKVDRAERERRIADALDKVGLLHLRDRYPHQLSGGQQQRVALARSLAYSPTMLLLDEPLSNLDAKLREQARAWLKRLQEEVGITTVYVTHDQHEALALSDRIAVMSEGRMLQVDTPENIYERPSAPEVAGFIGQCNFLKAQVTDSDDGLLSVKLDANDDVIRVRGTADVRPGHRVTVAIRPENLRLSSACESDNVIHGRVIQAAYAGARHEYEVAVGELIVFAESPYRALRGDVQLVVDPAACLVYVDEFELPTEARELITVPA
jgi:iron(III) transport system ATP-binding protein